jgi:hypothetical protein
LQAPPPAADLGYLKNQLRMVVYVCMSPERRCLMQRSSDGATELSTDQGSLLSRDQGTLTGPAGTTGSSPPPAPAVCTTPGAGWYPPGLIGPGVANNSSILIYFYKTILWPCLSGDYP